MKKVLLILGGLALVLALGVVVVAGIAIVATKGRALDKESKQYAEAAIPAIIGGWHMNELERRASPEFKSVMKDGDLEKLFAMFGRLGKLGAYKGCRGQSIMS